MIACNYRETTNVAPQGAKAYVVWLNTGNGHEQLYILVRSHSGRWVLKWERIYRLENFRIVTLPPAHPLYDRAAIWDAAPGNVEALTHAAGRDLVARVQRGHPLTRGER